MHQYRVNFVQCIFTTDKRI